MVSIITVNFNQTQVTLDFLESIRNQDYKDLEIIVVDNASKKSPEEEIRSRFPEVIFIRSEKNLGFAGGNNLGIKAAKGDFLFFINNDTIIPENTISRLVYGLRSSSKVGMISPLIYYYDQQDTLQYAGSTEVATLTGRNSSIGYHEKWRLSDEIKPTAYPHGAAMMIPRAIVVEVGLMPENFFLYYEELDWCTQIKNHGYEAKVDYGSYILHKESVSTGKNSPLKTYFMTRNRILYMRRNVGGIKRLMFLMFFGLVAFPKNILSLFVKGDYQLAKAYMAGAVWNIFHKKSSNILGYKFDYLNQ
jgi:GT2 family glycosyltransferase